MVRCLVFILHSKPDNEEPACDGRGVSLNSVILYPFSSPVHSSLPSAYVLRRSFFNRTDTQHCIVKIQFNIVSIAASQHVVFMSHRAVTVFCAIFSVLCFFHFNTHFLLRRTKSSFSFRAFNCSASG